MAWPQTGTVNATAGLNLRSAPNTGSSVLSVLSYGAQPKVTGPAVNGWYPVTFNGKTGYVSAQYLSGVTNDPAPPTTPTTWPRKKLPSHSAQWESPLPR